MFAEPTRTDEHRTIGCIWHASPLKNSSSAKAICLSTRNTLPFPHPEMIRSPLPLTIPGFCLCQAVFKPYLILGFQIPPSEWGTEVHRVEQGEPLRQIAHGDARGL